MDLTVKFDTAQAQLSELMGKMNRVVIFQLAHVFGIWILISSKYTHFFYKQPVYKQQDPKNGKMLTKISN